MSQPHTVKTRKAVELNGMKFVPKPGAEYMCDYERIINHAAEGLINELDVYRELFLTDLWFVVYFVLKVPPANHPFVVQACKEVQETPEGVDTLDLWARNHFKDLDCETLVPTPDGYKKHGDLVEGDFVYSPSGKPIRVVGRSETFTNNPCYRITFDNGQEVVCSETHLWCVGKKSRRRIKGTKNGRHTRDYSVVETRDIFAHGCEIDKRLSVPLASAFCLPEKDLPIPPYTLGAWLGDGNSADGRMTCHDNDIGIIERIEQDGFRVGKNKAVNMWAVYGLSRKLKDLGLLGHRRIPLIYLMSSIEQRTQLLYGLMDTDGTCDTRGTATFVSKGLGLAEDVFHLAGSLGLYPNIRKVNTFYKELPYVFYQVSFQSYKERPVFSLERKADRGISYSKSRKGLYIVDIQKVDSVPTNCIKVDSPDGLYVITERGVVTHNTTVLTTAEPIQTRIKRHVLDNKYDTTCILAYNRPTAKTFLRGIKAVFEQSDFLKDLFPEVLWKDPVKEAPKWSEDDGIILKRESMVKESCFEAYGLIEGMPTGRHFNRLRFDDISTADLAGTPEIRQKVKDRFDMSLNLGTVEGVDIGVAGTIYNHDDVLVDLMGKKLECGTSVYRLRKKPATHDGTFTGEPVLLSQLALNKLKTNPRTFATQQLLNPTPVGDRIFEPEFLLEVPPNLIPNNLFKFMTVDTAGDKETSNGRDAWAILLCGVRPALEDVGISELYILDAIVERLGFDTALSKVVDMYMSGGMVFRLGVESMGASMFDIHVSNALRAKGRIVSLQSKSLVKLTTGGRSKQFRIESALSWPFRNGMVKISTAVPFATRERIREELQRFPYWHDDALDALAYQYEVFKDFRFGLYSSRTAEQEAEDKYQQMLENKDPNRWMHV